MLRGGNVKDDSGSYAVFTEQGSSASSNDSSKSHGHHIQIALVFAGQAADESICLYPGKKWKMLRKKLKNSQIGVGPDILDSSYHDTNGQKSWSQYGRTPVVFFWRGICTVILWQGLLWEKGNLRKILLKHGCSKLGMSSLFHRDKGLFLICVCGWHKIGWKETKILIRCGKYSIKKLIWENQHFFLDRVYLGCTQRQKWNQQRCCGQLQNDVRIANFCGGIR